MNIYENFKVSCHDGLHIVCIDRYDKKNAINFEMKQAFYNILQDSAKDDNVRVTVITGVKDIFSSGNDFKTVLSEPNVNIEEQFQWTKKFFSSIIEYPKPIFAVVNGPAIGMTFTFLALMDGVFACDDSYFHAPFAKLLVCPEGCSSYLFPKIFGRAKAADILLFGNKLTAQDALNFGFVTKLYKRANENEVWEILKNLAKLPESYLHRVKQLMKRWDKEMLLEVNEKEMECLYECVGSEEFFENAVKNFGKSKL